MSVRRFAKIDVDIRIDPDFAALPDDSARLAFIYTFLEQKRAGGAFANAKQYDAALGSYARYLPALRRAELVVSDEHGGLTARSYCDWQSDPKPSTERVRRWRERHAKKKTRGAKR